MSARHSPHVPHCMHHSSQLAAIFSFTCLDVHAFDSMLMRPSSTPRAAAAHRLASCWLALHCMQATFSLVLNMPQSFSLLEDVGKALARYALRHGGTMTVCGIHCDSVQQKQQLTPFKKCWRTNVSLAHAHNWCTDQQTLVCYRWAPRRLYKLLHRTLFTLLLLRPVEKIKCPMVTVSDLLEQYNIR